MLFAAMGANANFKLVVFLIIILVRTIWSAHGSAELKDKWATVELNQNDKLVRLELFDNGYRCSF
jgi:hypothetical protein